MTTPTFRKIQLEAYKPGKSFLNKKKNIIKLSANESALGMSKNASKVLKKFRGDISKYPDGKFKELTSIISKKYNCKQNQVICGSGSDEIIQMLCQLFLNKGDEVVVPEFSFLMYRIYSKIVGAKVVFSKEKNFKVSNDEILKKITKRTKIVFVANPNNPTGSIFYKNELIKFLNKVNKKTIIVLDSAYCEYIRDKKYDDGMQLVKKYSNLIITRSFSKIFALGGLRVGWGYANSKLISQLYQYKKPFNVSRLSCIAAQESLKNKKWINDSVKNNFVNKSLTCRGLNNKLFETIDTQANFILLKFKSSSITQKFVDFLHSNKITVRSLSSYGLHNFVRMTIGTKSDMKKAVKTANKFNV